MKLRLVLCVAMASAVLAMCFGMASYTNGSLASVSLSEDLIDAALETRGYPRLVLDSMNPKAKEAIYRNADLAFNAACIIVYDKETGRSQEHSIQAGQPMPYGQIPTSDLGLAWVISTDGEDYLNVQFSYEWHSIPAFRFQDPIALSWDGDKFAMVDDTFEKTDYYREYIVDSVTGETSLSGVKIKSQENGYADGSDNGVAWYADLKGGLNVAELYGEASVTLEKLTSASGTSRMYGHYVHPTVSTGIRINVHGSGEFSVCGAEGYDGRRTQTSCSYESA